MKPIVSSLAAALLLGCGNSGDPYSVEFSPLVNGSAFDCATQVTGLGTTSASSWVTHYRMFVHDVALIDATGTEVALSLDDSEWQSEGVALLDFDGGGGACTNANDAVNDSILGTVPAGTEVAGLAFTVGVPEILNHIDATTAEPPFNDTGMWWTWSGGYKWTRIDFESDEGAPFYFHHGATGCDGSPTQGFECAYPNVTRIQLDSFDPSTQTVGMDLGALFSGNDFEAPVDFAAGDVVKGCMAFGGDPECQPIFNSMGINFEDATPGPAQTVFTAQ